MSALTPVRVAILKVISSFNGKYGLTDVETSLKMLPGIPESDWAPIGDHLDALDDLDLIRPEVTEIGQG
jgi:hypothetical protein